jgi:predicted cupin superfamily sugar epimerase
MDELVRTLGLQPHPEGGHFREIFRSTSLVLTVPGDERRLGLTTIYFLLGRGERSRWHRLASADEAWHHYEGAPLELVWLDAEMRRCTEVSLGPLGDGGQPVAVVPAGCWQAAVPTGDYTLVGCTVGPGFEFDDFSFLADVPEEAAVVRSRFEGYADLI